MTPETEHFLAKASRLVDEANAMLSIRLFSAAYRSSQANACPCLSMSLAAVGTRVCQSVRVW